jgi:hypothetical protein
MVFACLERRQRQLVSSTTTTTPRLHKALAASRNHPRHRQRRQLQQLANSQGEITMDVPSDNSGATVSNGVSSWILTATALVMSVVWMVTRRRRIPFFLFCQVFINCILIKM